MSQPVIRIKRGDTFAVQLALKESAADDAAAVSLAPYAITSQVRTQAGLVVATLSITSRNNAAGTFRFVESTATWPVGVLLWDVEYSDTSVSPAVIRSTDTVQIEVERDITRPAS